MQPDDLKELVELKDRALRELLEERDRRYSEVKSAEEKALKVKEQADEKALMLAREIQTYKDEKANELREQINSERGLYASKADLIAVSKEFTATIAPLVQFMSTMQGEKGGRLSMRELITWLIMLAGFGLMLWSKHTN